MRPGPVLVTGGAGFIGSHIVDALIASGRSVVALDDLSTGSRENVHSEAGFIEHDISAPGTSEVVARIGPSVVVHCAAQASVPRSVADPERDAAVNIGGSRAVAAGAARAGATVLVYLTTGGALYGPDAAIPTTEDHPIRPVSPYGRSKWLAEAEINRELPAACRKVSLRLANVYGPRQSAGGEGGVVSIFIDRLLRGDPIEIHGDGRQSRDFVYVGDVVRAVEGAIRGPFSGALNIGTGRETTILNLLDRLVALTGSHPTVVHAPPRSGDVRRSVLDVRAARRALGWSAATTLDDGLRRTLDWMRGS